MSVEAPTGLADHLGALSAGTTSVDLVERSLAKIEASSNTLNAFRAVRRDAALLEAAEADRRRAHGDSLPLLGVPIAIGDDSGAVATLRAAGAIVVGTRSEERRVGKECLL